MSVHSTTDVLVVDDEASVVEVVSLYLRREGFSVRSAADGRQALDQVAQQIPSLIVLDLMLPKIDGMEILRQIRQRSGDVPVIMLTARGQETDRIYGLELGADDYVVKPFSPAELVARVKAVLRRTQAGTSTQGGGPLIRFDDLEIDPPTRTVKVRGQPVELTATEFNLLEFLAEHPRQVFSRDKLLDNVWGYTEYVDPSTVTVHIRRLREKIEVNPSQPKCLLTVWGVGYKFDPEGDAMSAALSRHGKMMRAGGTSWLVLGVGILTGLVLVAVITTLLMQPPLEELATLIGTLAVTAVVSLAAGYLLYRRGWARSPSLMMTLVLAYVWAAILTLFNVWVMARLMFVNTHDLTLAGVLLLFAAIIATTFGVFVAASVTDGLRQLASAANRLASGDLGARAEVTGRDEISQVAASFNGMAAQLQTAEEQRRELEKLRRDLIAWTSHDLRTPLTSMRVMAEALMDGVVDDESTRQRYYKTIQAEVVALNRLIDDLFELAQIDAGGLKLEKSAVSLSDLISDTIEGFRPICEKKGVQLIGQVGPDLESVMMDASRIGRVLLNLVNNALQYTPTGGHIVVGAMKAAGEVTVTVRDSGPGFNPDDLPRVFERFYRGEQARSRATGGAGLGLAIASGIVAAHGGQIWAENVPEGGALVGFAIPQP